MSTTYMSKKSEKIDISVSDNDRALARKALWEVGDLEWQLDSTQLEIKRSIESHTERYFVAECARRLGKSYLLCVMAVERALKSKAQVLYAAPTAKDAKEFVAPILEEVLKTAPFKVKYDRQQQKWIFPNGSQIRLFACDNKTKANRGRGSAAHLVLIDEAGFIPVLEYVLHSIVAPQTLTTNGRVILASTPSDEPDHPFTNLAKACEEAGFYVRKTIYDCPRLTPDEIAQYISDDATLMGYTSEEFKETDVFKREFLALRAIDTNLVVIPDWDGTTSDPQRPEFFDAYVAFDAGGIDPHGLLFSYWDFEQQALVVQDELLLRENETTEQIAALVKKKEAELWGVNKWDGTLRGNEKDVLVGSDSRAQPYLRVCDLGSGKLELRVDGVTFLPTSKMGKLAAIDATRVLFRQKKILIHPRCKHLMRQIRTTMWMNEKQSDYRRTKDGQHGDLIDCLVYTVRNLRRTRDPKPVGWGLPNADNVWIRPKKKDAELLPSWRKYM